MLEWLETTPVAGWIQMSLWGYPVTLAGHAIGMAIVVGLTAVIALRLLSFPKEIPLTSLKMMMPALLAGLVLNALTGVMLFVADASRLFFNPAFQIKILMIVIGCGMVWFIHKKVLLPASLVDEAAAAALVTPTVRWVSIATIVVWWFSVVLSGRLIGYLGL